MTDWFARPVLHVSDVEASLRCYVNRLAFTSPWRHEDDGRAHVAQVERQGCALILADTWQEKIGTGLMFISINVEQQAREAAIAALDALRAELEATGVPSRMVPGATGSWWSTIPTAIRSSSIVRARLHQATLLEMNRNHPAAPRQFEFRDFRSGPRGLRLRPINMGYWPCEDYTGNPGSDLPQG
jgi:hypothetical protein